MKKLLLPLLFLPVLLTQGQRLEAKSYVLPTLPAAPLALAKNLAPASPQQLALARVAKISTPTTRVPAIHPKPKAKPAVAPASCDSGDFNTQFLCLLNNYRESNHLNPLSEDPALDAVANSYSTWLNSTQVLTHIGPNGSKFYERCQMLGTTCDAENLAKGYITPQTLFNAWKTSPDHNANMLGNHSTTGLSLIGIYATSLFR